MNGGKCEIHRENFRGLLIIMSGCGRRFLQIKFSLMVPKPRNSRSFLPQKFSAIRLYNCDDLLLGNASSFTLSINDFPPGEYNFTIDATDVFEQSVTEVVQIFLSGT